MTQALHSLPPGPHRSSTEASTLGPALPPRAVVLRAIWTHREISRADVARLSGLSRSTVSGIAAELLDGGLVHELRAGQSSGGRRPILLGLVDRARVVLGVDIGAAHVGVVLTDLRGRILHRDVRRLDARDQAERALGVAVELGQAALQTTEAPLLGVGLGLPAPLDPQSLRPHPAILPGWRDVDAIERIREAFDAPVRADNDANLGALAELWWGAGRGQRNLVFVKVATGVGAGIIIDGRVVAGAHGLAGELGHLSIDPNGPPCMCGGNGCLNVLVGTKALLDRARARLPHFPGSALADGPLDLPALVRAALGGDPLAREIMAFAGARLGTGLGNLMNVLDPSVLVLGGEITEAGEALLRPVREAVLSRTLTGGEAAADQKVVRSQADPQGVALGAATAILRAALETFELPLLGREMNA